jgi:hypothetical protein
MKAGFSFVRIATYCSTGMWNCAVVGSSGWNASSTILRAKSRSATTDGRGEKMNRSPS